MKTLEEIGYSFGTDKSSKLHGYLRFYDYFLTPLRNKKITFVELGINTGNSLRTWEEYFSDNATIIGVDIKEKWVSQKFNRAQTILGDCGDRNFLSAFAKKYQPHVLLDDASHFWSHQVAAFEETFEHIKPDGYFVMEDLNTSFGSLRKPPFNDRRQDAFTYFSQINTLVAGKSWMHPLRQIMPESKRQVELSQLVDWMAFFPDTLVIKKKA